ncbi:MAG: prepilin-type N-terminal cleavage/methylation domain-containing protein [Sedimentisphaerales bacterium]|nr:prepilin-type N-terminal cleavage/methylation domain-containing protein [Sedimentisphaerales bacterium]
MQYNKNGFTFIEILAALAIVAIAVVALLRLQLISINMTDRTDLTTRALFLAQQKIDETLALLSPPSGTDHGTIRRDAGELNWKREITDLNINRLNQSDFAPLRRVLVEVSWKQGNHNKQISLTTYIAAN